MDWFYFFARYYSYNKSFKSMKSTRIFIYFHLIVISQLFGTFYALMRCFCAFLTHYSKQLIKAMRLPVNGNNYSVPFKCQTKKNKSTITTAQILTEICLFRMMKNTREHLSKSVLTFRFIFFFIISLKCITNIKRPTKKNGAHSISVEELNERIADAAAILLFNKIMQFTILAAGAENC